MENIHYYLFGNLPYTHIVGSHNSIDRACTKTDKRVPLIVGGTFYYTEKFSNFTNRSYSSLSLGEQA